ncbi:MAG: ABC transporter permease [Gemmobacter sp.]
MLHHETSRTRAGGAFAILERIFHASVRNVRKSHGNAVIGLLLNILQTVVLVAVFYLMFELLGLRSMALRGDFLLYLMSGIFLFLVHIKTVGAVAGAEGPTSPMMKHAPMNTVISISSVALGTLYLQILSGGIVLFFYHALVTPVVIEDPVGAVAMLLMAWFTGVGVGVVLLALKPWLPDLVGLLTLIYQRMNMVASGKMFLANMLPTSMLRLFDWNPLFHTIDQARGFTFLNYNPHYTSISYPLYVGIGCLMLGLIGEYYTRRHASLSWGAKR